MPATKLDTPDAADAMGAERIPAPARAFGSTRGLTRDELIQAPLRWPRPSRLDQPLELSGKKMLAGAQSLGLATVGDLLEHLPSDSREARTVAALRAGEQATVAVEVRAIAARPVRRRGMRPLVEARVFDATGAMRATFFNQPWLVERYPPGTRLLLHGKADARGGFSVAHHAPGEEVAGAGAGESDAVAHYPAAEGVTSTQILTLVHGARDRLGDVLEALPGEPSGRAAARPCQRARRDALPAAARRPRDGPAAAGVRGAAVDPAGVPAPPRRAQARTGAAVSPMASPRSAGAGWGTGCRSR